MNIDISSIIGQPEGETLEYKAVLPPSRNISQIIASFANTNGGYLILGVTDELNEIGLSADFHANSITHKAIDILLPKPQVQHQYVGYKGKSLYVIKVEKSNDLVTLDGKIFKRFGAVNKLENPVEIQFQAGSYSKIVDINDQLEEYKNQTTGSKIKFIEHYQSVLKIMDDLGAILYPENVEVATNNQEGKILSRIIFSSLADNFETYLSDLLYEIFLAKPETLKSKQQVTIKEVLDCSDMQEFVHYWANKQIGRLQKGSVKGFIDDNKQIKDLNVIDAQAQGEIEKILQIRHLYSHRNGVVDEKFLQYFMGQFQLNSEHEMPICEILDKLRYLAKVADLIDVTAMTKYNLAHVDI
jgi:viroplasmin and RNaseH domain-containing protein